MTSMGKTFRAVLFNMCVCVSLCVMQCNCYVQFNVTKDTHIPLHAHTHTQTTPSPHIHSLTHSHTHTHTHTIYHPSLPFVTSLATLETQSRTEAQAAPEGNKKQEG